MTQSKYKYKSFYILTFCLMLSLLIMTFYGRGREERSFVDRITVEAFGPFHRTTVWIAVNVRNIWNGYIWLLGVRKENIKLKKRIEELSTVINHFKETEMENQRLRNLLDFRKTIATEIISAQIIGKDATNWFRSLLLDKGERDGVRVNQPVVTHNGLVGKVVGITSSTSQVELIIDKNSRVAAMIQKNRAEAILRGQSAPVCTLEYLDRDIDVEIGDCVISSGMGGIFPKGLMLGIITKLEKKTFGLFQYAEVTPKVPFSRLEEVLILKDTE